MKYDDQFEPWIPFKGALILQSNELIGLTVGDLLAARKKHNFVEVQVKAIMQVSHSQAKAKNG